MTAFSETGVERAADAASTPTTQCAQRHNRTSIPRAAIDCEREGTDLRLNNFGAMRFGKSVLAGRYGISTHVGCCTTKYYNVFYYFDCIGRII